MRRGGAEFSGSSLEVAAPPLSQTAPLKEFKLCRDDRQSPLIHAATNSICCLPPACLFARLRHDLASLSHRCTDTNNICSFATAFTGAGYGVASGSADYAGRALLQGTNVMDSLGYSSAQLEWRHALHGERDLSSRLLKLSNFVARSHPAGWQVIHARYANEIRAAGGQLDQLEATEARWMLLADEGAAAVEREREARYAVNLSERLAEGRRLAIDHWRERLPLHTILRALRAEIDEARRMTGVDDDAGYSTLLEAVGAQLKAAETSIAAERKAASKRVATARAAAAVQTFAPTEADAPLAA